MRKDLPSRSQLGSKGDGSSKRRASNFLLWQISYAELVITPTLWPDFRKPQFYEALEDYARRHRRFGGV